jgi:hypothetical protein
MENSKNFNIISNKKILDYLEKMVCSSKKNRIVSISYFDIINSLHLNGCKMLEIVNNNILEESPSATDIFNMSQYAKFDFFKNPKLIHIIEKYYPSFKKCEICLAGLCMNPNGINILKKIDLSILLPRNVSYYRIHHLCYNTNEETIEIIRKYIHLFDPELDYSAIAAINKSSYAWILLEEYDHFINFEFLFMNSFAIPLIKKKLDLFICNESQDQIKNFKYLCMNKNAAVLLNNKVYFEKIVNYLDQECWEYLCENKQTISLIETHFNKLNEKCFLNLCFNSSAKELIRKNVTKLTLDCWQIICKNLYCIDLLNENVDCLDNKCWKVLCSKNKALKIIEKNLDKLDSECWKELSKIPEAINLLLNNSDKINYSTFCSNEKCFDYIGIYNLDVEKKINKLYKKKIEKIKYELIQFVLSPDWITKMSKAYNTSFIEYVTNYYNNNNNT